MAIAALLVPIGFAQGQVVPVDGPVTYLGTYDVATQTIIPPGSNPADGSAIVYDNTAFLGSFFQPGPGNENMDWGELAAGGFNDITDIQIGYGTEATGTVDIEVSLNIGATGFGDPGTPIEFLITGLPASAGLGAEAFAIDVALPVTNLPDGPIGYSYEFFDALTGPLLVGPPNPTGVIDAFDQYTSGFGLLLGTFNFGGPPAPLASFYMQLTGSTPGPTCQTDLGGAGDGTMTLSVCGDPLDTPTDIATLNVDGAPAGATVYFLVGLGAGATPFAGGTLIPDPVLLTLSVTADGAGHFDGEVRGGGGPVLVYLQAAAVDGSTPSGKALSNALELDFGP
ncbi:MAG: hypothetical protein ACYTG2_03225 [Planctomycetota bacterium]